MQTQKSGVATGVKPAAPETAGAATLYIDSPLGANVRSGPGSSFKKVGTRKNGDFVLVTCYCKGSLEQGHRGPNHKSDLWYRLLNADQWVSHITIRDSLNKKGAFVSLKCQGTKHTGCR
jgi:hypothetical protein